MQPLNILHNEKKDNSKRKQPQANVKLPVVARKRTTNDQYTTAQKQAHEKKKYKQYAQIHYGREGTHCGR